MGGEEPGLGGRRRRNWGMPDTGRWAAEVSRSGPAASVGRDAKGRMADDLAGRLVLAQEPAKDVFTRESGPADSGAAPEAEELVEVRVAGQGTASRTLGVAREGIP